MTSPRRLADLLWPPGYHQYWKSSFLTALSDPAIETMVDHFAGVPSPMTLVVLDHLGGAISRVGPDETAFPHRALAYNFLISSAWADPVDSDRNIRWTREFYAAMEPHLARPSTATSCIWTTRASGAPARSTASTPSGWRI